MTRAWMWSADSDGTGFYRCELPARYSQTIAGVGMKLPADIDSYDVVIGQRVSNRGASIGWQRLKAAGKRLIFEIDDDLFSIDRESNRKGFDFFTDPETRRRLLHNIALADLVITSTPYLAGVMAELNPNVIVRPNCVDAKWLIASRSVNERTTIGWAGSSTHAMDFQAVSGPLRRFLRQNSSVDLHLMGQAYLTGPQIRHTPWVAGVEQYMAAVDFDIGIAPLKPHPFNRSKSYLKCLEMGSLGIPVVATDYGPYADFVEHGVTGFLVRYDHQWGQFLRMLVEDEAMRLEMGAAARKQAADFTIQKNVHRWDEAILELAAAVAAA